MGKSNSNQFLGHLTALFVVMIWGETFVSSKVLLNAGLMPADIFFYRFLLAYALIWFVSYKRLWCRNYTDELTCFALGILGGSLYFLTENMALVYDLASNVAILVSSCPLITAFLLSIFYKNERLNRKQIFGSMVEPEADFRLHLCFLGHGDGGVERPAYSACQPPRCCLGHQRSPFLGFLLPAHEKSHA